MSCNLQSLIKSLLSNEFPRPIVNDFPSAPIFIKYDHNQKLRNA